MSYTHAFTNYHYIYKFRNVILFQFNVLAFIRSLKPNSLYDVEMLSNYFYDGIFTVSGRSLNDSIST